MEKTYICHDCSKTIKKNEDCAIFEIEGKQYAKCKACFKNDPNLKNFRKTEVYSRVVGYIRPVDQWNVGKQNEFKDRKEFKLSVSSH